MCACVCVFDDCSQLCAVGSRVVWFLCDLCAVRVNKGHSLHDRLIDEICELRVSFS